MGGSLGRADALIGAVEAQATEGVLHLHFFLFVQMAHQFKNLHEIAEMIRDGLLGMEDFKDYQNHARCAEYSDVQAFNAERDEIEKAWPEYRDSAALCKPPALLWSDTAAPHCNHLLVGKPVHTWISEGIRWAQRNSTRLQFVMSHMNHHIHPVSSQSGERQPLKSCRPQNRPNECKAGFPLENEMTETALLICPCIAATRGLPTRGARSRIGTILPTHNCPWLNAGPRAWLVITGDNGDVKLPMRLPILEQTHERSPTLLYDVKRCCGQRSILEMAYEVQVGQSVTAGYFGGYSAKMQLIGKKEVQQLEDSISRKVALPDKKSPAQQFQAYSRRLVRDLEGAGIIRTAVETTNLMVHVAQQDVLQAECIRTFPNIHFPASELLLREEVEGGKVKGTQIITAIQGRGGIATRRAFADAPFDFMYGFRIEGDLADEVKLLSAYEMLMHWELVHVPPPARDHNLSELTSEGERYRLACKQNGDKCCFEAGMHYSAIPAENRILVPGIPCLGTLRHRWLWIRRPRPHVPVWSRSKVGNGPNMFLGVRPSELVVASMHVIIMFRG